MANTLEILLIALGLSMDAFAVSVSAAACTKNLRRRHMARAAVAFGLFQFLMPVAGWLAGAALARAIASIDHWIAFAILAFIGGKMAAGAFREIRDDPSGASCPVGAEAEKRDLSSKRVTLALAVATSIDALAVGIGFSVIGRPALQPAIVIGTVTLAVCLVGFAAGRRAGQALGRYAEIAGGLVLVAIGAKILCEHLACGL